MNVEINSYAISNQIHYITSGEKKKKKAYALLRIQPLVQKKDTSSCPNMN